MNSSPGSPPITSPPENTKLLRCLSLAAVIIPLIGFGMFARGPNPLPVSPLSTQLARGPQQFEKLPDILPAVARPQITNISFGDLDGDGRTDMLVCDAVRHTIHWLPLAVKDEWQSRLLVPENTLSTPAHTVVVDLDRDGDQDVIVAILHSVWPTDDRGGQVVALINDGSMQFTTRVIANDLCRVTDVQPGDFDSDGDVDLAVAEFGHHRGRILWLENLGNEEFADHELSSHAGCIHVPVNDYDHDGDLDIAALVSQRDEEVWIFENQGSSQVEFQKRRVWSTSNFDLGLAGMQKVDLDQDGDQDFLLAAGDNVELSYPCCQPSHGCIWLENMGDLTFIDHRIGSLGGTYAVDAADLDQDGDLDVVMASMFNEWKEDGATSLAWLENDGNQHFTPWHLAEKPTHLCAVACDDVTGDGLPDIVAGSLQLFAPFAEPASGLAIWKNILRRGSPMP